jgi:hypothetical protein
MRRILSFSVLLCALVTCSAQTPPPCKTGGSSVIEHRNGVTVQHVSFTDVSNKRPVEVSAHVFIPDGSEAVAGVAMTFAAIQSWDTRTDLLPFAWTLARAGAASIVLDRAIQWEPLDDEANLAPSVMYCASRWLLSHANLDRNRLATAGLYGWGDDCDYSTSRCCTSHYGMGFGQTGRAEYQNTEQMMTLKGQLRMAVEAQKQLHLSRINPEWLSSYKDDDDIADSSK